MNSNRLSLRFRLLVLIACVALVMGGSGVFVLERISHTVAEKELQTFQSYSLSLARSIEAQFYERYGDVQSFAENPLLRSRQKDAVQNYLNRMVELYGIYDLLVVTDTEGKVLAVNSKTPEGKELKSSALLGRDLSSTSWFQGVRDGKTTDLAQKGFKGSYFEDVQRDALSSEAYGAPRLGTAFSAAIRSPEGEWAGVISARAGARWYEGPMLEAFRNLKRLGMNTSDVVLTGKDGTLLFEYSSNPASADLDPPQHDAEQLLKYNFAKDGFEAGKLLLEGKDGAGVYFDPREKEPHTTGFAALRGSKFIDSIGWGVMVRNSTRFNEGLAELNALQTRAYGIFTAVFLLALLAGGYLSGAMARQVAGLANALLKGSSGVASTAGNVSSSSQTLSASVTEQAASLQESVSALEQITAMLSSSAENAARSKDASRQSHELSEEGKTSMVRLIEAIAEIRTSTESMIRRVEEGNARITGITSLIGEIGQKTKIINDIVFQTKLLSFNASVEAARAGEHGKGFSVVAEEVGNLAQMSGNAAKEISGLLESSTRQVEDIVRETRSQMEKEARAGQERVRKGIELATGSKDLLERIFEGSGSVHAMVSEISGAIQQQKTGIEEINRAILLLDQATQKNSTIAQGSAEDARQLNREAEHLAEVVRELRTAIEGGARPRATTKAEPEREPALQPEPLLQPEPREPKAVAVAAATEAPASKPTPKAETKPELKQEIKREPSVAPVAQRTESGLGVPSAEDPRFEDL